jgi:alkylated DNA repair dioxygenase AlkB
VPRLEAWYGPHAYSFGGGSFPPRALPSVLLALRVRLECTLERETFESCLANLYRDGGDSVAFHADDEPELGPDPLVACISLGAPRDFLLRRKVPTPVVASASLPNHLKISLAHGSLLVMQRGVQADWLHSLPKRPRCKQARVSLTFRA